MSRNRVDVREKVVPVTGGGRGIGRGTAETLANRGMRVAIGDLDEDVALEAASAIGASARGYRLDVTKENSFAAFVADVEADRRSSNTWRQPRLRRGNPFQALRPAP